MSAEIQFVVVDGAFDARAHLVGGPVHHRLHRAVAGEDFGRETGDTVAFGDVRQIADEEGLCVESFDRIAHRPRESLQHINGIEKFLFLYRPR